MRWLFILAVLPLPVTAQYTLYAAMATTKNYVVGTPLPPSGIFLKSADGQWRHAGYNHPFITALDYSISDPATLYASAGNGLLRITGHGERWKILTGSEVTELRDLAVDPNAAGTIYFGHSAGIAVTHDGGATWQDISAGLRRKYTEAIRVDRRRSGVLLAGMEQGVFRSEDGGKSWKLAGAAGFQVMHIEQSPHDACFWLASTQGGGLFASRDCGVSFESNSNLGVGQNIYDIAFDPALPDRIAVAGWGCGVAVSKDGGKTWVARNSGLPRTDVWSVIFDPAKRDRIYASVQEEALYVSDNAGETWTKDGLEGSMVLRMKFVPDPVRK
jgi:photosystem II stability/assembly factor-like uncharacterized protein